MPRAESVWLRRSVMLLAIAWPLSLHTAILFAAPQWPARVTAAAIALAALIWAIVVARPGTVLLFVVIVALLGATLVLSPQLLLFAPTVLINAALAALFGASLRPGREPVISVFARLEQGELQPDLARHARRVTWCWTLLLAAIAIVALALAAWASVETWSLFANVVSYALIAALFTGEYLYRRVRYRHYRHASLAALLRNVRRDNPFARR